MRPLFEIGWFITDGVTTLQVMNLDYESEIYYLRYANCPETPPYINYTFRRAHEIFYLTDYTNRTKKKKSRLPKWF